MTEEHPVTSMLATRELKCSAYSSKMGSSCSSCINNLSFLERPRLLIADIESLDSYKYIAHTRVENIAFEFNHIVN